MNRFKFLVEPVKVLVEPGAMPIFRLFTLVMQVILTLGICGQLGGERQDFFVIIYWIFNSILFAYLRIERLKPLLGLAYLPIGLALATTGPILAEGLSPYLQLFTGVPPSEIVIDTERLILWLIVPFLVLATQYNFIRTFLYALITALVPILISIPAYTFESYIRSQVEQGIVRLILFSLVGYVIVRLTQGEREQRQSLAEKNESLANYAATLEELAVSRERNRLARELHDTLSHTLSAVNIQLKALEALWETDPVAARERLTHMQALTRDGLNDA
ncbi:MAG: histidine kinase dimerization/phosphoacceptor domain-containing protein, partial [Chloroflexota bacterium]